MSQEKIISGKGVLRGFLDIGNNEKLFVYNDKGLLLGFYHQVQDKTYNKSGSYVGPGDQRMILLGE